MRALFVSPHADDVCLSLAGVVSRAAGEKHLVTVFSRSMWAEPEWDGPRDPDGISATRDREDQAFCSDFGLTRHVLGMEDSSIRHSRKGNLRRPSGHEATLETQVRRALGELVEDRSIDVIVGPMGLGKHADHLICSRAAMKVAAEQGVRWLCYEDLPYATESSLGAIGWQARRLRWSLRPLLCETPLSMQEKIAAANIYESQRKEAILDAVAGHSRRLAEALRQQTPRERGAKPGEMTVERLWTSGDAGFVGELFSPPAPILRVERARVLAVSD